MVEAGQTDCSHPYIGIVNTVMRRLLIALITVYKACLSPFLGHHCRFHPTCSSYAIEAIEEHGAIKGSKMALRRIGKCHPWHEGGVDPVPTKHDISQT